MSNGKVIGIFMIVVGCLSLWLAYLERSKEKEICKVQNTYTINGTERPCPHVKDKVAIDCRNQGNENE